MPWQSEFGLQNKGIRDQGSPAMGSGAGIRLHQGPNSDQGIKDQKYGYKNGISDEKTYLVMTSLFAHLSVRRPSKIEKKRMLFYSRLNVHLLCFRHLLHKKQYLIKEENTP